MMTEALLAAFTRPEHIGTNPQSMLYLLPLTVAIAVVYKATKLSKITVINFIKEVVLLFGSIAVFIGITAAILFAAAWLIAA